MRFGFVVELAHVVPVVAVAQFEHVTQPTRLEQLRLDLDIFRSERHGIGQNGSGWKYVRGESVSGVRSILIVGSGSEQTHIRVSSPDPQSQVASSIIEFG